MLILKTWEVIKLVQENGLTGEFEVTFKSGSKGIISVDECQVFTLKSSRNIVMPMYGGLRDIVEWKLMNHKEKIISELFQFREIIFKIEHSWADEKPNGNFIHTDELLGYLSALQQRLVGE